MLRVSGLVSAVEWGADDIAEIELTTDFGSTYLLLNTDALGDPFDWIDRYVEVSGFLHRDDGHKILAVTRIREVAHRSWDSEDEGEYGDHDDTELEEPEFY